MKAKLFITCLMLMVFMATGAVGQDRPDDRRMTPQEQIEFEKSVKVNPARVIEVTDELRAGEPVVTTPPTVWKPIAQEPDDRPLPTVDTQKPAATSQPADRINAAQPEAPKGTSEPVSRRTISGSKTQPEPEVKSTPVNRRTIQGPKTQPEPKKVD